MRRPFIQLLIVFLVLGIFAWWVMTRVALSPSLLDFLSMDDEPAIPSATTPQEQEKVLMEKMLAQLPAPPQNHSPEVAALLLRLKGLENIPQILTAAVERDKHIPKGQTRSPWSEAELAALHDYHEKFYQAWEPFFSGPQPNWELFPDSAFLFRSQLGWLGAVPSSKFMLSEQGQSMESDATYDEENRLLWFSLSHARQTTNLAALQYGGWGGGWGESSNSSIDASIYKGADYSFSSQVLDPNEVLSWAPPAPSIAALRQGLKTDRAVFLRAAEYLDSLPAQTPAPMALTRLLGNQSDAEWFVSHVQDPKTAHDLALIIRQGAEQISTLEQKTYLSGPAWRQWTIGNPEEGLGPALRGSLQGMINFEETQMQYQVGLAFVKAASAYRQSGFEGMKKIPDPARPGSFLSVTSTTNEITISSAYQVIKGENFSFSFEPEPSP